MDELIKALAKDVRCVEGRRVKLAPFSNMEVGLYGKATGFKVALGRTLLASEGKDFTDVDLAMDVAQDYLNGEC